MREEFDNLEHLRELGDSWVVEAVESLMEEEGISKNIPFDIDYDVDEYGVSGGIVDIGFDDHGFYAVYWLFEDYETAESYARHVVTEMLVDDPGMFNKSWLISKLYITDIDKRMIAQDDASSFVDGLDDDELADVIGGFEGASNELLDMARRLEELKEVGNEGAAGDLAVEIRDRLNDEYAEYVYSELDSQNWIDYFEELYSWDELLELPFIRIDIEEAVDEFVRLDGPEHFIDSYDGRLIELDAGALAVLRDK